MAITVDAEAAQSSLCMFQALGDEMNQEPRQLKSESHLLGSASRWQVCKKPSKEALRPLRHMRCGAMS